MSELMPASPAVLLAEDEPLLLEALESELKDAWPGVNVVSRCRNGAEAISAIQTNRVDIAFLDIQMPQLSGLEVVQYLLEEWPDEQDDSFYPPPLFVFVTAYTDYAIEAFELAAVDYVVKPLTRKRMGDTVERLKQQLASRVLAGIPADLNEKIAILLSGRSEARVEPLRTIKAGVGDQVYLIPVEEVILFEASDKYIEVHTSGKMVVIRESLRALLPRLDEQQFRQIHRKSIVNMGHVKAARRDKNGKVTLELKDTELRPVVSRLYRHLFRGR